MYMYSYVPCVCHDLCHSRVSVSLLNFIHVCSYVYVCMYTCILCVTISLRIYVFIYAYTYICVIITVYTYMYMYVYVPCVIPVSHTVHRSTNWVTMTQCVIVTQFVDLCHTLYYTGHIYIHVHICIQGNNDTDIYRVIITQMTCGTMTLHTYLYVCVCTHTPCHYYSVYENTCIYTYPMSLLTCRHTCIHTYMYIYLWIPCVTLTLYTYIRSWNVHTYIHAHNFNPKP